jgi:single-strand DNA-binding protein
MANKAILIGNLGSKPEVKQVNDANVCTFRIATSESYKDKNGEKKTETTWHNIVAWRGLADVCEKYLDKGSKVYVEGKIRNRSYEKDSHTFYVSEIIASSIELLGSKPQSGDNGTTTRSQNDKSQQEPEPAADNDDNGANDLPF